MTASELRIGNWVFCKMENDDIQIELDAMYDVRHYMPIPLDQQWLLKLGWQFEDFENDPPEWLGLKIGFKTVLMTDESVDFKYIEFNHSLGSVKIQYVHQLQNLYFALTGDELELKTDV